MRVVFVAVGTESPLLEGGANAALQTSPRGTAESQFVLTRSGLPDALGDACRRSRD
ncbi:hypothetical protein OHA10_21120 [Kribbella sp. NBC_00662]|uniref:hypothetical protein n=1 Tax=Kribbella sp. NBC_00662 TaxID=2975969 RepID=UPI00324B9FE7